MIDYFLVGGSWSYLVLIQSLIFNSFQTVFHGTLRLLNGTSAPIQPKKYHIYLIQIFEFQEIFYLGSGGSGVTLTLQPLISNPQVITVPYMSTNTSVVRNSLPYKAAHENFIWLIVRKLILTRRNLPSSNFHSGCVLSDHGKKIEAFSNDNFSLSENK